MMNLKLSSTNSTEPEISLENKSMILNNYQELLGKKFILFIYKKINF
jgi:hypothetical protein